jgi:hypothetical protein
LSLLLGASWQGVQVVQVGVMIRAAQQLLPFCEISRT